MISLYNNYIYQPLLNFLVYLYQNFSFSDLGIAVILLTIVVRIIMFPLFYKGAKDQAIMNKIAPKIKEIQTKHKEDKQKQIQEMMALYKEHKVNPMSQFALLLVQLPILIALFKIFSVGIKTIPNLNPYFLGIVDLTQKSVILVALAAVLQYVQSKLMLPKTDKAAKNLSTADRVNRQMVFIGPVLTFVIFMSLPSVISLYWLTFSLISVIQQVIINKRIKEAPIKSLE
ncbi:MAG: YidC/Oxa1 family membrane protein insertase [Patescibacteria group bacterium]